MLFLLKKIVSALILPPTCLLMLAFVGLCLTAKYPKMGRALVALSLLALLTLSLPITGDALLESLESMPPISQSQLKKAQAIIILGGGKNLEAPEFDHIDTVNRSTLQRLRYGAYLQAQTGLPILVTGGAPFGGRPEAEAMAETLVRDFHAKDIWTESQSKDTAENAAYSAPMLKEHHIHDIALVSQPSHLVRAAALFEQQGLVVYPAPTGYRREDSDPILNWLPQANALHDSTLALKEYLGLLSNYLKIIFR